MRMHRPDERPNPEQQSIHTERLRQRAMGAEDRGNLENIVALHGLAGYSQDFDGHLPAV